VAWYGRRAFPRLWRLSCASVGELAGLSVVSGIVASRGVLVLTSKPRSNFHEPVPPAGFRRSKTQIQPLRPPNTSHDHASHVASLCKHFHNTTGRGTPRGAECTTPVHRLTTTIRSPQLSDDMRVTTWTSSGIRARLRSSSSGRPRTISCIREACAPRRSSSNRKPGRGSSPPHVKMSTAT